MLSSGMLSSCSRLKKSDGILEPNRKKGAAKDTIGRRLTAGGISSVQRVSSLTNFFAKKETGILYFNIIRKRVTQKNANDNRIDRNHLPMPEPRCDSRARRLACIIRVSRDFIL